MGSIAITVIGDGAVGTKSKTYTVSDADIGRLVAFSRAVYATTAIPNPTITQGLVAWADAIIERAKANVRDYERVAAIVEPGAFTAS